MAAVLYVLLNPKKSFASMPVIDESAILVHNGQSGSSFQQGANSFFQNWNISNTKSLLLNSLADNPNLGGCKSREDEEQMVPEAYNWNTQYPQCVRPVKNSGNCSASYALATLSAVSDRIC